MIYRIILFAIVTAGSALTLKAQQAVGSISLSPGLLPVQANAIDIGNDIAGNVEMTTMGHEMYRIPFNDYAQKARRQQTTAFVMLGVGAGMAITGLIVGNKDDDSVSGTVNNAFDGTILLVGGALVAAGSIPFFISAGKNRTKAGLTGGIKLQSAVAASGAGLRRIQQPAMSLQLNF